MSADYYSPRLKPRAPHRLGCRPAACGGRKPDSVTISGVEGVFAAIARSACDGLLADVMPPGARGKAQANYSAAGTAGSFVGATTAGFLYALTPGAPFFVAAVVCFAASVALFAPSLTRLVAAAHPVAPAAEVIVSALE